MILPAWTLRLTRLPIDLSIQTIEVALRPLCDYLSCDQCKQLLRERINHLVAQWSIVKVWCFCAVISLLITFCSTIDRERSSSSPNFAKKHHTREVSNSFLCSLPSLYIHVHVYHILSYVFIGLRRSSPTMFHTLFCHTRFNAPDQHPQLFLSQWHHTRIAFPVVSLHHRFCRIHSRTSSGFHPFLPSMSPLPLPSRVHIKQVDNGYIICNHDEDTVTGSSSAVHQLRRCRNRYNHRPEMACSNKSSTSTHGKERESGS